MRLRKVKCRIIYCLYWLLYGKRLLQKKEEETMRKSWQRNSLQLTEELRIVEWYAMQIDINVVAQSQLKQIPDGVKWWHTN